MKSEQLNELATALAKAQAEMPAVPMNAVNPFLKNKYADLAEMIRVASPVLAKHGLSISQQPVSMDGQIGVVTTLLHTSGQWIEDTISLPLGDEKGKSLAQVAGSIITYLRRYSYGAIVGLATDEDTDGNAPAKKHEQPETSSVAKIGTAAATAAVENALYEAGNEVSKRILKDPDQTASTALLNIGAAGVLGGVLGGGIGAVSPLWAVTGAKKADDFLRSFSNRVNNVLLISI